MRERWFGATGRKVPEIALEGDVDLEGALVLDGVVDLHERAHAAHVEGVPVVVRVDSADEVVEALSHGEVACVLVRDPALLEVDLTRLTYG
jgi:hypothetical protein